MKLVVLLGIVCVGLVMQEVSAMNVMAGSSNLPSLNLANIISKLQQVVTSFVQGLIAALNNTNPPSINQSEDIHRPALSSSGSFNSGSFNSGPINIGNPFDDDSDDDDDEDEDDEASSSGSDNINIGAVDFSGNTGQIKKFHNIGNNGPAVPNGQTMKYGYSKVMTHIPTISEDFGRIVKLEKLNQGKNGINVILLREHNGISTYYQKGPITDVKVDNKKDGVLVTFKRNGKQESVTYK